MPPTTDSPRPAATVALIRPSSGGIEVLLVERPAAMTFAGGLHAFPGGVVDPGDRDPGLEARSAVSAGELAAGWALDLSAADALAAAAAAVREVFEETGILLARAGVPMTEADLAAAQAALLGGSLDLAALVARHDLVLATDRLVPLSRWVTPRSLPKRFDARFYVAELPAGAQPAFAAGEVAGHAWLSPRAALEAVARKDIRVLPPTSTTLQQLEHVTSVEEVRARLSPGGGPRPSTTDPLVNVISEEIVQVVLPAGGGIPGQPVNAYLVGRRELVLVDPGDPGEAAGEAILAAAEAKGARIGAIALTHPDPDHAAGALGFAMRLDLPVYVGPGGGSVLPFEVRELDDGEPIPAGDVIARALATPGHRPEHLVFELVGAGAERALLLGANVERAVLVGDLVGGLGRRSVYAERDIQSWRDSLRVVAEAHAGPTLLLPGHGAPVAGRAAVAEALSAASATPGSGGG